jgi:cell division protein FtsZ
MKIVSVNEKPQVIPFPPQMVAERGPAIIKVVSVGGGGANALNRMIDSGLSGVEFIAINTDVQDLQTKCKAHKKLQIGSKITGGTGAGGNPKIGEQSAEEDSENIAREISGINMLFITAGMGGGTGTGAAPVIAAIAKEMGILTVAIVTTPFEFEGRRKMSLAMEGIEKLRKVVDTVIIIPNQNLFKIVDKKTTCDKAYSKADDVLRQAVQCISDIINKPGFMNTDFADIVTIMKDKGVALMGIGTGTGENRDKDAVKNAIDNPLLEDTSINGATGILVNVAGSENLTLIEVNEMVKTIKEKCDPDVNVIFGLRYDHEFGETIQLTVIATGFGSGAGTQPQINNDVIKYEEFINMKGKTRKPDYLNFLPQREYQDDLDIPPLIRNYNYETDVMNDKEKKDEDYLHIEKVQRL